MVKTLKTLVIGLGRIGWNYHIPSIIKNEGFKLVATVDTLKERITEAEQQFGCRGYTRLEEALVEEKPDLTVVASPTKFHAAQVITAFRHDSDVFCDKPMAVSYEEAQSVENAMRKYKRKFMVYQPRRISPDFIMLKEILKQGLIGPLFMIKRVVSNYDRRNDWQAFKENGGGMLNNYGAHYIDQLLNLAESKAVKVNCSLRTIASCGDADDVVKAVIVTETGVIIDLDINQASAISMQEWQVFGKYGSMQWENNIWHIRYYDPTLLAQVKIQKDLAASERKYGSGENIPWKEKDISSPATPFSYYDKCYEYYALDKSPIVDICETMELMRVIDMCRENSDSDMPFI